MPTQPIKFVFEGDTSDLEKALAQVGRKFDDADKKAKGLGISGAEAAKAAKAGMLAAAAAAAVLAVAFAKTASAALDLAAKADKIAKSAAAVGASAEEWQKVIGAFELGGLTAEQTEMAIKKLGLRIGQVAAGAGGPAADAFAKLGLTWQDLEALPLPERMATIADRVKGLGSATQRAAVLNAIFEESGIQMAGAFAEGGDAIRDAAQQIEDAGLISNKVAKQAEDMTNAVTLARQSWEGLRTQALAPIIPMITEVTNVFIEMMNEFRDTGELESFGEAFVDTFLEVLLPSAVHTVGAIQTALGGLEASFHAARFVFDLSALKLGSAAALKLQGRHEDALKVLGLGSTALEDYQQSLRDLGGTQETVAARTDRLNAKFAEVQRRLAKNREEAKRAKKPLVDLSGALSGAGDAAGDAADQFGELAGQVVILSSGVLSITDETPLSRMAEDAADAIEALKPVTDVVSDIAGSVGSVFGNVTDGIVDSIAASQEELSALHRRFSQEQNGFQKIVLQEQIRAVEQRIEAEKEAAMVSFGIQKAAALAQAAIQGALGVLNALATGGAAAPALAVAAGVTAGFSIAAIAAEPPPSFHSGGMVSAGAPDEITARLLRSEAVLSPQGVAAAGGEDGVRDLNRGAGGSQPVVSVLQVRSRVVDAMISDNLRTRQGPLTDALRAARPRALGRHNPFASS